MHKNTHTHKINSIEYATVEKVVQETCYEVVFDDGSVCASLPASQIIKVSQLRYVGLSMCKVYNVCVSQKPSEEQASQSLLASGTKVKAKWTDGKTYSAKVLGQHVAPSYVVSPG